MFPFCRSALCVRGGYGLLAPREVGARGAARIPLVLFVMTALVIGFVWCAAPAAAWADSKDDRAEQNALADADAGFGLTGFTRYQTGNSRPVEGEDIGYRYPLDDDADVVIAVTTEGEALVFVDEEASAEACFAAGGADDADVFRALAEKLDERVAKGGETLADNPGRGWTISTASEAVVGSYRVRAGVAAGGRRYVSVVPAEMPAGSTPATAAEQQGLDLSEALSWVDTARLVPASAVAGATEATLGEQAANFFSELDMRPFWVSLKTSAVALVITFVLGLFAAWKTMGTSSSLKGVLDSVFTIPMVLPPTVCGFLLLLIFGNATPLGRWLIAYGVSLVFTWEAAVIAAVVVSFPLMYRTALGAFESLDASMLDAARTLGWSEARIFRRLMMPLAWPSIAAGTVLAFARAMGEFGCTLFFAGNYAGVTQTIPIAIYFEWMSGNTDVALFWVVVVILFSFVVVLFINLYTALSLRYRERGGTARRARSVRHDNVASAEEPAGDVLRIDRAELRSLIKDAAAASPREGGR